MTRRRLKQLSLALGSEKIVQLAKGKRRELVEALAELLLSAARKGNGEEGERTRTQRSEHDDLEDNG